MIKEQRFIRASQFDTAGPCPVFVKSFSTRPPVRATLDVTAKGVYYAELNGLRVGNFIMAPGYTQYSSRLQVQSYDITNLIKPGENTLEVTLSGGWYAGRIASRTMEWSPEIIAEIVLSYEDGTSLTLGTDETWLVGTGPLIFSDIYHGEVFDARKEVSHLIPAVFSQDNTDTLIAQEGETVEEQEIFSSLSIFTTPNGETVVDFGQNLAGYPVFSLNAKEGEVLSLSFAETLDKNGNFYNENYRSAKCQYHYTCRDGFQSFKPRCTFYGFRYIRIDQFPESATLNEDTFTAIAVYSKIKKTGHISTSNSKLNQLFSNVLWGQRSNFLDVPTDCPQRNERYGWTGDALCFCKTASYNFDVLTFFKKWLRDMDAMRKEFGYVGLKVPGKATKIAAAWTDAAVFVPWQIYLSYGDREFLEEMIDMMVAHVDLIGKESEVPNTWRGGNNLRQFGDWLATDSLDKDRDAVFVTTSYSGATNPDFLQAAFYAQDAKIVADALDVLGRDSKKYRDLADAIKEQFQKDFTKYNTQTECIIALRFGLAKDPEEVLKLLIRKIRENGNRMSTGFVGTPHILHALSENGRVDLAYTLLLQEQYPSWLFCVNLGATTMWEHWDSINLDGDMWSTAMNSFNHYAYGAVADWIYEVAAGIRQEEKSAGFSQLVIHPHPDKRLDWLEASYETKYGTVSSKWTNTVDGGTRYEISVPRDAKVVLPGKTMKVSKGNYIFFEKQ